MIYLRLSGGLGNQLFQLATAMKLSASSNEKVTVSASGLNSYSEPRSMGLCSILNFERHCGHLEFAETLTSLVADKFRLGKWLPYFSVNDKNICNKIDSKSNISFMDGYFQDHWSKDDFFEIVDGLRTIFKWNGEVDSRLGENELLVHLRGGDFKGHPDLAVVDFDWYFRSIQYALRCDQRIRTVKILSEDKFFAEALRDFLRYRLDCNIMIVRSLSVELDFILVSSAPTKVISNSTFGFWAHALGGGRAYSPHLRRKGIKRKWLLYNEVFVN